MKKDTAKPAKELYKALRKFSPEQIWEEHVRGFDAANPEQRGQQVGLIRAIGVIFSERGAPEQKQRALAWLRELLTDPDERIRRYAVTALPKLGAGAEDEAKLLELHSRSSSDREKVAVEEALQKIGGASTLEQVKSGAVSVGVLTRGKLLAAAAREEAPSLLNLGAKIALDSSIKILLRSRAGLEEVVRDEITQDSVCRTALRVVGTRPGVVSVQALRAVSLAELCRSRCFATLSFLLADVSEPKGAVSAKKFAEIITGNKARQILRTLTTGSIRYRLDFPTQGHQRALVKEIATEVFNRDPEILNDPREAVWTVSIVSHSRGARVELVPKLVPDPRFTYREGDVPASSHPPLAASLAHIGGMVPDDIVWDPFCGSGVELIERGLLGKLKALHGTDRSAEAITIARGNYAAAKLNWPATFTCCDFREYASQGAFADAPPSLIITNPPMGRRVIVGDLRGLIQDLFNVAQASLKPGGRLVLANPVKLPVPRGLRLRMHRVVDLGGFNSRIELYQKQ